MLRSSLLVPLCLAAAPAAAAPDFPETFAVQGVAPDDVLNLRAEPSAEARKIGEIPPDATGVVGIRCVAPGEARWCRVRFEGLEGWANARFLRAETAAAAAPLYSVSPRSGSALYRSFLVSKERIGRDRYAVTTRHLLVGPRQAGAPETGTATVDCGARPAIEAAGGRIDLAISAEKSFAPPAHLRDAHNLWWSVCRGLNTRYGGA